MDSHAFESIGENATICEFKASILVCTYLHNKERQINSREGSGRASPTPLH